MVLRLLCSLLLIFCLGTGNAMARRQAATASRPCPRG